MAGFIIRTFDFAEDYPAVYDLWQKSSPGVHVGFSDSPVEIQRKLERDPDLFLVAVQEKQVIGTVIGGFDGRRGLVYHLAVADAQQDQGIGKALMREVEQRLNNKGCYKCYLLVVNDNNEVAAFYNKLGWEAMQVTVFGKELR